MLKKTTSHGNRIWSHFYTSIFTQNIRNDNNKQPQINTVYIYGSWTLYNLLWCRIYVLRYTDFLQLWATQRYPFLSWKFNLSDFWSARRNDETQPNSFNLLHVFAKKCESIYIDSMWHEMKLHVGSPWVSIKSCSNYHWSNMFSCQDHYIVIK